MKRPGVPYEEARGALCRGQGCPMKRPGMPYEEARDAL